VATVVTVIILTQSLVFAKGPFKKQVLKQVNPGSFMGWCRSKFDLNHLL
jgi:hypothetical protein